MEQERGDCGPFFPRQGSSDGHAIILHIRGLPHASPVSFHAGEGYHGEVSKISGDFFDPADQLMLICQFCKNPQLKHLRLECRIAEDTVPHIRAFWTELMRELRDSTSLEYLELSIVGDFRFLTPSENSDNGLMPALKEMLSGNSSLLGVKFNSAPRDSVYGNPTYAELNFQEHFFEAISENKTVQVVHVRLPPFAGPESSGWNALLASLTADSSGHQTNTSLRSLYLETSLKMLLSIFPTELFVGPFISMLESNTTLTAVNIPAFGPRDFIRILKALEVNRSVSSVSLDNYFWIGTSDSVSSTEDVFDAVLKLINFRNVHGYGLTMVDVRRSYLDRPEYVEPIQAALKRKPYAETGSTSSDLFVRPTSCRVFLCGFPEAGKTTLRKNMKFILREKPKKFHIVYSLSKRLKFPLRQVSERTKGVEVVTSHSKSLELSLWDMGGQDEFHAFHDLVIPNLSDHGSASLFILVCSMATTKDGENGVVAKSSKAIDYELRYWLRFLSSNTRASRNSKVHVIVVFTHVDMLPKSMNFTSHVGNLLQSLKVTFAVSFEFSSTEHFVDSTSLQGVEPFVDCVVNEVKAVLSKVPKIYKACLEMQKEITKWKGDHPQDTIIKWERFVNIFKQSPSFRKAPYHHDIVQDVCKLLASSLNEGGYILYFEDLEIIVVDPNWFGTRIIGSIFSIDHKCLDPYTKEPVTNDKGYIERGKLISVLKKSFNDEKRDTPKAIHNSQRVDVNGLIFVMKKLNICFEENSNDDGDEQRAVFIPATLRDEGGLAHQGRRKLDWDAIGSSSSHSILYIGRRLHCEDSTRTFLTHGFFPRLQVVFERMFGSKRPFRLEKKLVAFTEDGMQVFIEHSGDLCSGEFVDGFIDIMVQSLKNPAQTLQFVKQQVVRPIRNLCASPTFGCQGVTLLESILRPKCVEELWLCSKRRNHAIEQRVLVKHVLAKQDFEGYMHHWQDHSGDEARTLLGDVVWNYEIVNVRMAKVAELASDLMQDQLINIASSDMEAIPPTEEQSITSLECLFERLKGEIEKGVERVIEHVDKKVQLLYDMQCEILQEISKNINKLIDHSMHLLQRQVPCYVYVTTLDLAKSEWLINSLVPGLKSVQLHLMCEHKGHIHVVDDQKGVALRLESETLRGLRPYVIWGLRIITMLVKVSANVGAGLGSMVPNLEKALLKGVAPIIPNISSNVLGVEGTPSEQVNLLQLKNYFKDSETKVAEQWLVNFLADKHIQRDFGLQRVCYTDGSKEVAWVCQKHVNDGRNAKTLELCPVQASGMKPT